jgi:hypothetical protein
MNDWAGFKKLVHELAEANLLNEVLMQEIEDEADTRIQFAFQDRHEQEVNNYFTPNNYDKAFLPGFVIDGIGYFNYVWVPDANSVDTTLPHVVCPYRTSEAWNDSTTGYYWDAGGQIDSLMIHWEDDPTDDYYIWVVLYEAPSTADHPLDPERDGYCGDGVCDLSTEDETCADCDPVQQPGGIDYVYEVVLESIEVYNDEKQYFESWLSNKYDFTFVGCIFSSNVSLSSQGHYGFVNPPPSEPIVSRYQIDRDDVCRKNGNKQYNCPSQINMINKLVATNFIDGDTLLFIGYEENKGLLLFASNFNIGIKRIKLNGDKLAYPISVFRNDKAVTPYYQKTDKPNYQVIIDRSILDVVVFQSNHLLTIGDFSSGGSNNSVLIDNGEWRYNLKLRLKE